MKYQILTILLLVSLAGIGNMIYRHRKGQAYRELKKVHKPSQFTLYLLDEYEHFFRPCWWHWFFVFTFVFSLGAILIDTH
tara:strand:+ start:8340 stop:8579 length:240 start_codon:yes stop_codon:yes gene_type:complete